MFASPTKVDATACQRDARTHFHYRSVPVFHLIDAAIMPRRLGSSNLTAQAGTTFPQTHLNEFGGVIYFQINAHIISIRTARQGGTS